MSIDPNWRDNVLSNPLDEMVDELVRDVCEDVGPFVVSIYFTDRAYGGPEEGGWWYDVGEPSVEYLEHLRVFKTRAEAEKYQLHLDEHVLPECNRGRRPVSSVCSTGWYVPVIDEGKLPAVYPTERPHYE